MSIPAELPLDALERLLGRSAQAPVLLGGGGNSRVYRVRRADGETLALKAYFRDPQDPRDRLGVEFGALHFLWEQGLRNAPRPVAVDPEAGLGLMEFIPGERIERPGTDAIDVACTFLGELGRLASLPAAARLPMASEASFSLQELDESIQARLERLEAVEPALKESSGLGGFLAEHLLPAWRDFRAEAKEASRRWAVAFDQPLPLACRTLSPSDFGFHNALKTPDRLVFIDFEYFGWDDPAKMLVDFLLHPAMELDPTLGRRFAEGLLAHLPIPGLRERARLVYPLFGIKWCAILLNEFLPGPLRRRRFAAPGILSPAERQARQLAKCRAKLQQVRANHEHFTLFNAPF